MAARYTDDEEAAYEVSHLLKDGDRHDDDDGDDDSLEHTQRHESPVQYEEKVQLPAKTPPRSSTEFLDGLRGLAAVWVFVQHFMPAFTMGAHENGFGMDNTYFFVSLPYVRLFFGSGGNTAVVIFFVLSGYVLSISPLRKLKQEKAAEVRKGLLGALIRRPVRLYLPPIAISFIHAVLLHVPGLFLPVPWLKPEDNTMGEELAWWWEKTTEYFSPFREHGSNLFAYPYNVAMWTLPIEMAGSIVIYSTLAVLSLGLRGPDARAPAMVVVMIFCAGAVMLQHFWKWSVVAFLFGQMLAILDTWPVGEELRSLIKLPKWFKLPSAITKRAPKWPRSTPTWTDNLRKRWTAIREVKILPEWLSRRLPKSSPRHLPEPDTQKSTIWPHICFFVGFYLLSEPAHAGDINFSLKTPGWVTLTKMIPDQYDELRYYRYWQTYGAMLGIYSVCRIRWLQYFFTTRFLRFLGYVSFMLYLVHLPFFRIFPDRFNNLIGYNGDPHDEGTFWDKSWEIPDWGPVGMTTRFWVSMCVSFPATLLLAWLATIAIDQPSVRLSKLVTRLIGLDTSKPTKKESNGTQGFDEEREGVTQREVIYTNDKEEEMEDIELQDVGYRDEDERDHRRGNGRTSSSKGDA